MRILREWVNRLRGTLGPGRRDRELEQELRLHLELAAEDAQRRGHSPQDAARAARLRAGGVSQAMDALRDQRGLPWLDALASDVTFAWRQLKKRRAASGAAILSLGLAIGATTAAFRLVDAVLLRPLPVVEPERLFFLAFTEIRSNNRREVRDDFEYPMFRRYVETAGRHAELMVVGTTSRQEVIVGAGDEPERAYRQYVSGNVFGTFGLQPALGRLLAPSDDVTPGAHPVAVLSYDYWSRRFARDPGVIGTSLRIGNQQYDIVGVAPRGFIGTEPGRMTDVFIPATMNTQALNSPGVSWFRIWVRPNAGVAPEQVREMVRAVFAHHHRETVKSFPSDTPKQRIDAYLREEILLLPAGAGASGLQSTFRRPLFVLAGIAALVLLIACANVGNLLTAQAMTRAREMALRVSIGAGRWRLIQLMLVEGALLAICASAVGTLFAWWAAPFVVSMLELPDGPVRLVLGADWRALGFGVALAAAVTVLFGLAPALRASSIKPLGALKDSVDPLSHRRLTNSLIAAQMAFCVFVLFVAGLFVATFARLSNHPLGFSHQHVLVLDTDGGGRTHPPEVWAEVSDHLRQAPGVESVAFAGWALLSDNGFSIDMRAPGRALETQSPQVLPVSPGFFETMRIELIDGREFRPGDRPPGVDEQGQPLPGVAIVNETFARRYFDGRNPVGRWVMARVGKDNVEARLDIVGWVRDASFRNVREPIRPGAYVPTNARSRVAFLVRAAGDPLALAPTLRREVSRSRSDLRVRQVAPQSALVERQMILERLLATLLLFFAVVALLLAAIGLYGVLNSAVIQRRREIGVRMALGARASHVVNQVMAHALGMACVGSLVGLAAGLAFGRVVETLLFQVKATDAAAVLAPMLTLAATAALAVVPPAMRAVRIDPAQTLRSE